mmetsp:Transcript_5712/g.14274  ORF Transcript_5712/g.14274 Transcript_5712/m.14274 type:complete len:438 (-) Transcript_5712:165-1478(-)
MKEQMMRQSTIYKRHEARLARSYALHDDPRPAIIRVMSGLPGFRMIVPRYQSRSKIKSDEEQAHEKENIDFAPGTYSEETVFEHYSGAADNNAGATLIGSYENPNFYINASVKENTMQAMLATGVCSGAAEYLFSYCSKSRNRRLETARRSPFFNSNIKGSIRKEMQNGPRDYPLFSHQKTSISSGIARPDIHKGNTREILHSVETYQLLKTAKKTRPSNDTFFKAIFKAFPVSLLFGAKMVLNSSLEFLLKENGSHEDSYRSVASDFLSSAIAGCVVGLGQLASIKVKRRQNRSKASSLSVIQQQHHHLTSSHLNGLFGRNIAAAVLYFSIYDGISTFSLTSKISPMNPCTNVAFSTSTNIYNNSSNERKGTVQIAVGGALAGIVHAAAMNYHRYGRDGSMIWWRRIMLPSASRAAPIHAFIFFGYEKVKEGVKAI